MAKHYDFSLTAQPAEFGDGFVTLRFGLSRDCKLASENFSGTLAEGLLQLADFSARTQAPHSAFLRMLYRDARKPAGFDAAKTRVDRET